MAGDIRTLRTCRVIWSSYLLGASPDGMVWDAALLAIKPLIS